MKRLVDGIWLRQRERAKDDRDPKRSESFVILPICDEGGGIAIRAKGPTSFENSDAKAMVEAAGVEP